MRIEKTFEIDGNQLRVIARMRTRKDGERVCSVRIYTGLYFRDLAITGSSSIDEAMERAVGMFLGREERSSVMRLENVKVGETYTLAVGRNAVPVTVTSVDEKGKISDTTAGGKTISVADAARLTVHHTNAPRAAKGAKAEATTPKGTKAASGRDVAQKGASRGEGKRLGLVDAAIQVMKAAGKPMNCQEVVKAILEQKLWESAGKTPAATLYSSILREIVKKGADARFKKVERGQFALAE
jgi:hypothetical protein